MNDERVRPCPNCGERLVALPPQCKDTYRCPECGTPLDTANFGREQTELDSLRSQLAACRELSEALIREADAAADSDDEANIAIGKRDAAARIRFAIGESRPHSTTDLLAAAKRGQP